MNPLLAFHAGTGTDHRGRYLRDILQRDDRWLETTHDYVQWLFPLREPSSVLPSAPTIDAEVAAAFAAEARLRETLRACFQRMLTFYGLALRDGRIVKGANWTERKADWFTRPTHNNLRISRILKCLSALGLRADAQRLADGLEALRIEEPDCGVGATAYDYWREAAGRQRP